MDDEETLEQHEHDEEVEPAEVFDRVRAKGVTVFDEEDEDDVDEDDDEDEPIEDAPTSKFRFSLAKLNSFGDLVGELAESSSFE